MPEAAPAPKSVFLGALARLHDRFLVDVEGVTEVWMIRHGDASAALVSLDDSNIDPPHTRSPATSPPLRAPAPASPRSATPAPSASTSTTCSSWPPGRCACCPASP